MMWISYNKHRGAFAWLLLCFLLCAVFFHPKAHAQTTPENVPVTLGDSGQTQPVFVLNNFYLSSKESMLTARLTVGIDNLQYLNDILRDGARLVIECNSRLYRKRTFWADTLISEYEFSSNLNYDPLQRNFTILSESGALISNYSLEELLKATWGNLEMPLAEFNKLEKDETYVATISLELKHAKMPPWLSKNVFFWSDVLIPKQEYELEFDY